MRRLKLSKIQQTVGAKQKSTSIYTTHDIRPRNSIPDEQESDISGNAGVPDDMTMPTEVDYEELEVVPNHAYRI